MSNPARGRRAVESGQYGEDSAEAAFYPHVQNICNFKEFEHRELYPGPYPADMPPVVIRQYPVRNPFNKCGERNARNDFMIFAGERIFCQVKNQNKTGTTDEKIIAAFSIAQFALTTTPYDRFLLVLLGVHWKRKAELIARARTLIAPQMELNWQVFGGKVAVDIVHGPLELATKLAEYKEEGIF